MAESGDTSALLPAGTLEGVRLGISVSQSPDLAQLGLVDTHLRLTLGEIARAMLVSSARIVYGGHLDPNGYTAFLQDELQKYSRRDRPLQICLAWPVHRGMSLTELHQAEEDLGLFGHIVYLDAHGSPSDPRKGRANEPDAIEDPEVLAESLTSFRHFMTSETDARLLVGGRRRDFQGRLPGVLEEALLALTAGQPLFLAGGFGGVARDVSRTLFGGDPWAPPSFDEPDPRFTDCLERVGDAAESGGWHTEQNGLSSGENARLAASHRPSDVASLVALGLGRLRAADQL